MRARLVWRVLRCSPREWVALADAEAAIVSSAVQRIVVAVERCLLRRFTPSVSTGAYFCLSAWPKLGRLGGTT
jgi:hypothetical protein